MFLWQGKPITGHAPERDDTDDVVRQVRDEIRARIGKLVGELNAA
ncbi:hypothetical protein [Kribbella sp. DT2]